MTDMYDILGLKCKRSDGTFGVEIEVEGKNLPTAGEIKKFDAYWRVEKDNSLRGEDSAEYVFNIPLPLEDTKNAIYVLDETYKKCGSEVEETYRAGVHVHLNIQSWTPLELLTFLTTYYMLENYFCHWAGESRVGNHFCLRAQDAEYVIYKLLAACKKKAWRELNTDEIRYASVNLNAMHKYGSVEFRAMRSSKDLNDTVRWVELINQLVIGSKRFENPRDVVTCLSMFVDGNKFMEYVMGDLSHEFHKFENGSMWVWEGMEIVQPLAFGVDWDIFNRPKINPFA